MILVLFLLALLLPEPGQCQLVALHEFGGGSDDGQTSWSSSVLYHEGKLYGMTRWGGDANAGVLFSVTTEGNDYTHLHEFGAFAGDGIEPHNSLKISGTTLYGMALSGGSYGQGTVFEIDIDGTGYNTIHHFNGTDGSSPHGDVIPVGDYLYGLTRWGGTHNIGVIFRLNRVTHIYDILHSFAGYPGDGNRGHFGILHVDGVLYGQTWVGGTTNHGTIWRIDINGSNYEMLHSFDGTDGTHAHGSLIMVEGLLYGLSPQGGTYGVGTAYRIHPDGTGFEVIHQFGAIAGDNGWAIAEFLYLAPRLVACGSGMLFSMNTDGSDFRIDYGFDGTVGGPASNTIVTDDNGIYYGMTGSGGSGGYGVVYKYNPVPTELEITALSSAEVELSWNTSDFNLYQLQAALLPYPGSWEDIGVPMLGNGGTMTVVEPVIENAKFYRVVFIDP